MKRFFSRTAREMTAQGRPFVALCPKATLYIVGDVHGMSDLLETLLEKIDADVAAHPEAMPILVFVGDYVDRGDQSAQVLARLQELYTELPDNVVCLMGNHERMMLDFLDDPVTHGSRWLRYGGLQTLASYGVRGLSETTSGEDLLRLADALHHAMPQGQEEWLRAMPLQWSSGNISVVHAAASPNRSMASQQSKVLLWGHPEFMEKDRADDICVVHGHTVVDTPQHRPTRIAVDTGAYYSGRLTAAAITPTGDLNFLQT